jgi:hypothetical protein
MRQLLLSVLALALVSCADPAFQKYIACRQAAIAALPNGQEKFYEQARLDEQIMLDKRRQQQQAAMAASAALLGIAAGVNAYNASRPVNVNVWHWR